MNLECWQGPLLKLGGRLCFTIVVFLLGWSSPASAECPHFSSLQIIKADNSTDPFEMNRLMNEQTEVEETVARELSLKFLAGTITLRSEFECIKNYPERHRLRLTFQRHLILESLNRLRTSKSAPIQKFMLMIDQRSNFGKNLTINLTGHGFGAKPANLRAGYHRRAENIFMDLDSIPSHEWLTVLVHELAHYLDSQIYASILKYSDQKLLRQVSELSQKTNLLTDLKPSEREMVDQWNLHGLNAGILAEYRAWAATLVIYRIARREGIILDSVEWMDEVSREVGVAADPWPGLMTYLHQRVLPSEHVMLSWPLIQAAQRALLDKLVHAAPDLGIFTFLLDK